MTMIELTFFVINVSIGVFVAWTAYPEYGLLGVVIGFVGGFLLIPALIELPGRLRRILNI